MSTVLRIGSQGKNRLIHLPWLQVITPVVPDAENEPN